MPIRGDPGNLNQRDVEMAEEALPHHLGDMGEVDVDVLHLARVDFRSCCWIGLIRHAKVDAVHGRERAI